MLAIGQIAMLVFITYTEARLAASVCATTTPAGSTASAAAACPPPTNLATDRSRPTPPAAASPRIPGDLLGQLVNRAVGVR
jgi:hypothetical protein